MTDDHHDHLDTNAAAAALREVFTVDVTAAVGRCTGCGRTGAMAETHLYTRAPGLVGRCPACDTVLFRLVRAPGRAWLDLRGLTCLEIPLPEDS
jgi:hypothetical protein